MSPTIITILLAAVVLAILATVSAMILGWANRKFYVYVDPKIVEINDVLPGANCGGCGYVGCGEYAEAVRRRSGRGDALRPRRCRLCPSGCRDHGRRG